MKTSKLAALLFLPIILAIVAITFFSFKDSTRGRSSAYVFSNPSLTNKWQASTFTSIDTSPAFSNALGKIDIAATSPLPVDKEQDVRRLFYHFILAHFSPEYQYFENFRFPVPNGSFAAPLEDLKRELTTAGVQVPPDPKEVVHTYWKEILVPSRHKAKGNWVAVDLTTALVSVETFTYPPPTLSDTVLHHENISALDYNPTFVASPTLAEVLAQHKRVECATFHVIAKAASGRAGPFYLKAYFDPGTRRWIPHQMVDAGKADFFHLF